jgi:hypothetical protein
LVTVCASAVLDTASCATIRHEQRRGPDLDLLTFD